MKDTPSITYLLDLLQKTTTDIFSSHRDISESEMKTLCNTDPQFKKHLLLEIKNVCVLTEELQSKIIQSSVSSRS